MSHFAKYFYVIFFASFSYLPVFTQRPTDNAF